MLAPVELVVELDVPLVIDDPPAPPLAHLGVAAGSGQLKQARVAPEAHFSLPPVLMPAPRR